jgi:alpha-tubulin suppressor-like RCC1 family protein
MAVSPRPAAAAPADFYPVVDGPKCPDVVVVAARGSGEQPQPDPKHPKDPMGDWTNPVAYTDTRTSFGVGPVNYDVYQRLWQAAPRLHFGLAPVQYPADAVFPEVVNGIVAYLASVESGAATLLADVDRIERTCGGGVKYLFTGYSQGAWVVYKALWQLPRTLLGKVVGVALFGDPEFVPFQEIVRDSKQLLTGLGSAVAVDAANRNVPKSIRSITASYCIPLDPVCQAVPVNPILLLACKVDKSTTGSCPHYRYVTDGKTAKAARFLRPHLPVRSVWPRLTGPNPPVGKVGSAYSWTATAAPTAGTSYTWTALDAVPPGLRFSSTGVLFGTPTTAGRYSFRIQARSVPQDRIVSDRVSVRIRPGSAPPPPPGCASGSCAVAAWGMNIAGQLGDGTTTNSSTPVQTSGLTGVTAVASGFLHSLALRSDGTVWAWGNNSNGQLGNGTTTGSLTPVQVSGLSGVIAIAAGFDHSLALRTDGTVWAWGQNQYGQLGNGTTTNSSTPVQVSGLSGVTAIAAGVYRDSLALRTDGTVWAWGRNPYGQLGNGTTTDSSTPVQVSGLSGVTAIAAGALHSLALRTDGTVWAWGGGYYGQLGNGTTTDTSTPVPVSGLSGATAIAGGFDHSLAVRTDGTVWAWGHNIEGQLGNGTTTDSSTPVQVGGLSGVTAIGAGALHSLALRTDGTVWAWGHNQFGQLGNGTTVNSWTPVQTIGVTGASAIATSYWHSLALRG